MKFLDVFRDELPRKHSPRLKLEGIDESLWRYVTHHGKNSPGPDIVRMDRLIALSLTGAWPLFVGGVIGLVNSVNGRDHCLLTNVKYVFFFEHLFQGRSVSNARKFQATRGLASKNQTSRS